MPNPNAGPTDWVTLARLVKPRGIKGEISVDSLTSGPERFLALGEARLFSPDSDSPGPAVEVENAWQHGDRVILKLQGIDSMSAAEPLAGMELRVPLAERPAAPEGEYYQSDLIGCEVVERNGTGLGEVTRVENYGGHDLLVVKAAGDEILVPLVKAICVNIDVAGRRITVELPEGLKDLAS